MSQQSVIDQKKLYPKNNPALSERRKKPAE
jgi:hypothetical protein